MVCLLLLSFAPPPEFAVYQRDEAVPIGPLARIDPDWAVELLGADELRVAGADLVELRQADQTVPDTPAGPRIVTSNGDVIGGDVIAGEGLTVDIRVTLVPGGDGWRIPLSRIDSIHAAEEDHGLDRHKGWVDWTLGTRENDALLLRNGDLLIGTLVGIGDAGPTATFRTVDGTDSSTSWDRVAKIGFSTALMRSERPKDLHARLAFRDGTRLTAKSVVLQDGVLEVTTYYRQTVEVPVNRLVSLRTINGPAVYLSSLTPEVKQRPFFGLGWPWRTNRSLMGDPIRLLSATGGTDTFDDGIGVAPGTTLGFTWEGAYRRVEGWVGTQPDDDPERRIGTAAVRISSGDRQTQLRLAPASPGRVIRHGLGGSTRLEFSAEFENGGPVLSAVNWGSARLVR